jgi:bis(5'-nucleosyl)-tetraphosphatase (symmetrical)
MALYLIGDIQGCDNALERLLSHIDFSPSRDTLYFLGDLVNRGPNNVGVLQRLMQLEHSAQCLLGNHDLHLLAVAHGVRPLHPQDTTQDLLQHPQRDRFLDWLRHQHMALLAHGVLMVHAGVLPMWSVSQTLALAGEVEQALRSANWVDFLPTMYGGPPHQWQDDLAPPQRLRVILNALTRLRFCTAQGDMDFSVKESAAHAPAGLMPWFDVPNRQTAGQLIAFGHWSTLQSTGREDVVCLDDGCVWGGCLTALKLDTFERLSVKCPQALDPLKTT